MCQILTYGTDATDEGHEARPRTSPTVRQDAQEPCGRPHPPWWWLLPVSRTWLKPAPFLPLKALGKRSRCGTRRGRRHQIPKLQLDGVRSRKSCLRTRRLSAEAMQSLPSAMRSDSSDAEGGKVVQQPIANPLWPVGRPIGVAQDVVVHLWETSSARWRVEGGGGGIGRRRRC